MFLAFCPLAAAGNDMDVTVTRGAHGSHVLHGEFSVDAPVDVVWETLTDYDGMGRFVSSVVESHLRPGPVVEQRMAGALGPFRREIVLTLAIDESPKTRINFEDVSRHSFSHYRGSWQIHGSEGRVTVLYDLEATPTFFAPAILVNSAFRRSVATLLEEVRRETIRRTAERLAATRTSLPILNPPLTRN